MPTEIRIALARLETMRNIQDPVIAELCETITDIVKYFVANPKENKKGIGFQHDQKTK